MDEIQKNEGEGARTHRNSPAAKKAPASRKKKRGKPQEKAFELPAYHVVLLDDNDHTDVYVVEMLSRLFGHNADRAAEMAVQVTNSGRVVVMTTHKELAELKRDQILSFGADPRLQSSKSSMNAVIEAAAPV